MSGIEADAPVVTHTEMAIVQPWIPLHMNRRWIYSDEHLDEFDFRFDASGEDRDENWRCPERYAQLIPYCLRLYSDGWQPVPSYCCSLNEVFVRRIRQQSNGFITVWKALRKADTIGSLRSYVIASIRHSRKTESTNDAFRGKPRCSIANID